MKRIFGITLSIAGCLLIQLVAGCGSTDFGGESGKSAVKPSLSDEANPNKSQPPAPPSPPAPPVDHSVSDSFVADVNTTQAPVDLLFLVDTSGSMAEEKARLEQNMGVFLDKFFKDGDGSKFRLFLIGSGFNFPASVTGKPGVQVVSFPVGSTDALNIAAAILDPTVGGLLGNIGLPIGFPSVPSLALRPEAAKEFVIVTDDNASGPGVDAMRRHVTAPPSPGKGPVRVHGMVGLRRGFNTPTCNIARVGSAYQAIAALSQPPGLIQDLCLDDWAKLLDNLGVTITMPRSLVYTLTQEADPAREIIVVVDGTELAPELYDYDEATNTVTIKTGAVDLSQPRTIEIVYYPKA